MESKFTEDTVGAATNETEAEALTLLQQAEKKRAARETSLFLDVPTWDGDLIVEYRVPDPDKLRLVAQAAMRRARDNGNPSPPASNDVSLIIAAHVGLYIRKSDGSRLPIEDEFGHVGFNRMAKVLGKEDILKSNDDVVRYLMAERNEDGSYYDNITAITMHANKIQTWMRDPSRRANFDLEELLGEL
jgi:hypothetical protein